MLAPINRINKEEKAKYKQKMKDYVLKNYRQKRIKKSLTRLNQIQIIIGRVTTEALFQLLMKPEGNT